MFLIFLEGTKILTTVGLKLDRPHTAATLVILSSEHNRLRSKGCAKMLTTVGLKLDRPRTAATLVILSLEHNRLRSKDLNVVAGLPVPYGLWLCL